MYFLVTIVFEFPSFEMWTESQSAQTIQLTVSFFKKSLTFWCKYIRKFLYYVDIMFCLLFCSYILTVHTLMFVVKPYLSICMICSYSFGFWVSIRSFLKAWCIFRSFSYVFFSVSYHASDILKVWYYYMILTMMLRRMEGMSLRALVFVGMKNFSIDL